MQKRRATTVATTMTLVALTGVLRGREFTLLGPASWVLGRSRGCRLRLPGDSTVSRQHCVIELDGESAWVQDLGSRNGTHLNGQNIGQRQPGFQLEATLLAPPRQELRDGDELRVGTHVFVVLLSHRPLGYDAAGGGRPPISSR
jgi:pSer/pThr/pTyr-binding forkhead associated (FHA) protein